MRYRQLGRTELQVSELSLGVARGAVSDATGLMVAIRAAVAAGINFIDTAGNYEDGACESVLGEALLGHDEVIVQTKYLPYDGYQPEAKYTGTPSELILCAEQSLRRLKRARLDILLGHGIRTLASLDRFMTDGCLAAMVKLREQGKARFIGISELSEGDGTHEVLQRAVPTGAFDVVMLTLNFLLQTAADSVLSLCRSHNVGTVIMMPLNQASKESGLVSVPAAHECVRRHIVAGNLPDASPYTDPALLDFLRPYSVPEAALRFVLAHDVNSCCVGMHGPQRISDNLRAIDPPYMDMARLARLRELFSGISTQVR